MHQVAAWFKRAAALNRKPIEEVFPEGVDEGSEMLAYEPPEAKRMRKRDAIKAKLTDIFQPGGEWGGSVCVCPCCDP